MTFECHTVISVANDTEEIAVQDMCDNVCFYQAVENRGIHAGKVNCDVHQHLCQEAQVNAYPSVRFYAGTSETRPTQVSTRSLQVFIQLQFFTIHVLCASIKLIITTRSP